MIKLKWAALLITALLSSGSVFAGDSFVGNGGSAGDLELLVAKKQLAKTFYETGKLGLENSLCKCEPVFEGRGECAPLVELNKEEVMYCSDSLQKMSGKAARMLENNKIAFRWTKEDIFVKQGGRTSTADAVANSENDTITLNQQRFLSLSDTERLFLLTHEIFHLVPSDKQNNYLSDEGDVGPYEGKQGARRLLNAMAAGTVVEAYRNKSLQSYKHILMRRKSYMKNWIDFTLTPSQAASDVDQSVYAQESFGGASLEYRKYFGASGVAFKATHLVGDKDILSATNVQEVQSFIGAGLSHRLFPFKDPSTFLGQSFLNVSAFAELGLGKVRARDGRTGLDSKSGSFGGSIDLKYNLPLQLCWVHLGGGIRKHRFDYSEFDLINNKIQPYFNIGVSHAF